jgi:hypothetical protein
MFDPTSLTFGQVSSTVRDFAIVAVLWKLSWATRGLYGDAKFFIKRVTTHMTRMERFATILLNNHLKHIEFDLKTLSGRKDDSPVDLDLSLDAAEQSKEIYEKQE